MKYSVRFLLLLLVCLHTSCADSPAEIDFADTIPDTTTNTDTLRSQSDTLAKNSLEVLRDVSNWKTADFIINEKDKSSASVRSTIENEIEQWKNVENPFTATYKGCDMGDYFHLIFEDQYGKTFDFGFGNNHFGEYDLCSKDITDNPKYLGKSFVIYWNWEISSFPCCDGEYDLVEAYMPSITKLELKE